MGQYTADPDASPFDRSLMTLAQVLDDNGHEEDAEIVGSAAAELREFQKLPGGTPTDVYRVLEMVQGSAASVMDVIGRNFPPPSN
jgi:hypothetical protein